MQSVLLDSGGLGLLRKKQKKQKTPKNQNKNQAVERSDDAVDFFFLSPSK